MTSKVAKTKTKKGEITDLKSLGQEDIPNLLKTVDEKIKSLTKGKVISESTKGIDLSGFGYIENIDSVEKLIKAYSSVNGKENAYIEAANVLNLNIQKFPFKLSGKSAKIWKESIIQRCSLVVNKVELDKLKKVKTKLESNLSAKAKLAKDLGDIRDILSE